jgi:hypothetical protein
MKNYLFSYKEFFKIKCDFNDNGSQWNKRQVSQLLESAEYLKKNWKLISKSLGIFCENECETKYVELKAQQSNQIWTEEEDERLKKLKGTFNSINWFEYNAIFPERSHSDYVKRCSKLLKNESIPGNWSHSEEIAILKYVKIFKFSWKNIIQYLPRRSQNSVKSYFHSTLRRIKKSSLFEFLKLMITWPTYTNKSMIVFLKYFEKMI